MNTADKPIDRVEQRAEFIDRMARAIVPVLMMTHSESQLSEQFWRRILQPYFWGVAKRHNKYADNVCSARSTVYPIDGFELPSRAKSAAEFVRQLLVATARKKVRSYVTTVDQESICISLGNSARDVSEQFHAVTMEIDFSKCFVDRCARHREYILNSAKGEGDPIVKNALRYIPEVYVEYFDSFLALCTQVTSTFDVTSIYVEHFPTFFDLFFASYLGECGAEIIQLQLGAGPGEIVYPGDSLSKVYYDKRLTYGWRMRDDDIPYFGVRLERFKQQYDAAPSEAVTYDALLIYNRLNSAERYSYYEHCNRLIGKGLDRKRYPRVIARPRRFSRRFWAPGRARIPGIDANLKIEVSSGYGPIAGFCRKARIVVHWSHPATNFLECIFVDHPVVAVSSSWEITEIFKPFYNFFVEAGVLHAKPEQLIDHLNRIEAESWWRLVMADPRYGQFKEKFCRSRERYELDTEGRSV